MAALYLWIAAAVGFIGIGKLGNLFIHKLLTRKQNFVKKHENPGNMLKSVSPRISRINI